MLIGDSAEEVPDPWKLSRDRRIDPLGISPAARQSEGGLLAASLSSLKPEYSLVIRCTQVQVSIDDWRALANEWESSQSACPDPSGDGARRW